MPERDPAPQRQRELYERYLQEAESAERSRDVGAGLFGLRGGPADDPCHDRFAERLHALYGELAAQGPESAVVRELLTYACTAPGQNRGIRSAYWMLIAVQGLCRPLIALLTPSDARSLRELWESSFKRSERLPVQVKLIKELKAAEKG